MTLKEKERNSVWARIKRVFQIIRKDHDERNQGLQPYLFLHKARQLKMIPKGLMLTHPDLKQSSQKNCLTELARERINYHSLAKTRRVHECEIGERSGKISEKMTSKGAVQRSCRRMNG
ncbi:hypothetical protein Trydic_g5681 [Trypoxylus dichotomus]